MVRFTREAIRTGKTIVAGQPFRLVEGLNSKIKTAMKRTYGFKQTQYLKIIVYLVVGKLCFD